VVVHADGETFEGDRVVVTLPLGVLQGGSVAFDPPLEGSHALAVKRLAMGTEEKVALRFPERFWPESVWQITDVADDRAFPVWFDFSRHVGSPTLVALYNPAIAPTLAELPPEQRVGPALEALRRMFGSIPDPDETLLTDWIGDPWALGSYSYVPAGARVDDMRRLAEPVSAQLVLAGEATVPASYGTVHAAFGSGLRAAGHALGTRPERLSLGAVAPHWVA
jgi:monoamine oxidase